MKKKKIIGILLIAVIFIVGIGLFWYNSSIDMLDLNPRNVATIQVQNGNTGEMIEITNQEDITYLIEQWNNTELSRQNISLGYVGYSLHISLLDDMGKELSGMNDFYINSNNALRKDPIFYGIQSGT